MINRCRKPSDADILVPGDTISLIGTTSLRIDYNEIDDNRVTAEEVDILLREGEKLAPVMAENAHFAGLFWRAPAGCQR
ncbi:anaerobic glycerol-3-phosphate dehydrogenase subunit A [Escherichia coli]|nr:anaerobic glycerol-3-phosphate dehydrogenase subunit A [Escherichia coli]